MSLAHDCWQAVQLANSFELRKGAATIWAPFLKFIYNYVAFFVNRSFLKWTLTYDYSVVYFLKSSINPTANTSKIVFTAITIPFKVPSKTSILINITICIKNIVINKYALLFTLSHPFYHGVDYLELFTQNLWI